jgi:type IV pilus assembly protein PilB
MDEGLNKDANLNKAKDRQEIRKKSAEEARDVAARFGIPYVDISSIEIDAELFRSVPLQLMLQYNFLPLEKIDGVLKIAIADPSNIIAIDEIELQLNQPIQIVVSTLQEIQEVLKKGETSQRVLDEASEGFKLQLLPESSEESEVLSIDRLTKDSSPMIKLVDTIILNAIQRRASDIHIENRDREVIVKYRVDGALHKAIEPIDKKFAETIISRIKIMSELDIAEKRIPQDGRFRMNYKNRAIDFRVSIMPNIYGEDAVIRILDKESIKKEFAELNLDVLGFTLGDLKKIRKYIKEPYGMFLVTGPTGSGKTTTLYAAISEIKREEDKLITIEDPVEYQIPGIIQVPVNEKKGLTFARGLRSILRHDPDKIMVGEIRDSETAHIAVQSALTGHLVLTTVHANNVVDVIGRLLHMGLEPYNFVSALNCISAQRLVRVICPSCKHEVNYPLEMLKESGLNVEQFKHAPFYEGKGCIDCSGTGFKGRTAIMELLELSDIIREMILQRRPAAEIKKAARQQGMVFLREAAVERVKNGITTLPEINKVTFVE